MRKAALGIGIGVALIIVLFVGRIICRDLSGFDWDARPMTRDFKDMPKKMGDWVMVKSGGLPPKVFAALGAKDAEVRTYEDSNNNVVYYHGSVFGKFHSTPKHTPLQCYPANGWEIINQEDVKIPLSDGRIFMPTLITIKNRGERAAVLFWFQFGDFIVMNREQQRKALDYYRPDKEWPCMFKGMLHMPVNSSYQGEEPLKKLAAHIYEYTRTLQDGKVPELHETDQN